MASISFKDPIKDVLTWPPYTSRINIYNIKKELYDQGFICVKDFLSETEIDSIMEQLSDYSDAFEMIPREHVFVEDKARPKETLIRLEQMHKHHDFFKALAESPCFNGLADVLLGLESELNNVQFFSKPPGAKATPPHQDGKYFMHCKGITFWLALDRADEENGCLYYVPGSHNMGELDHCRTDKLGFSQELKNYPEMMREREIKQEVSRGALLAHHPYTVHRAGENLTSGRWRPAMGLTYWAKSCRDDEELHNRRQEYHSSLVRKLKITNLI